MLLMILKGDGGAEHRFTAGQEEWKINVFAHDYQYHVIHPSPVMYVARSVYQEQQLSTADLERVKDRKHLLFQTHDLITENLERVKNELESHGFLYGSMRTCFQVVTKEFCKEPSWVKKNALITLKGDDRTKLQFAAGGKEWKINVFAGDFQYRVTSPSPELYLARLRSQQQLQINANLEDMEQRERLCNLTIENLQRTMNELESHGYSDEDMRTCFQVVLKEFPKEPSWVKENALMTLKGDGAEFQFAAGKEDWKINVSAGDYQYWVIPPSPEMRVARLCSMQQLLIPRHLKSMQDSLESGKVMASPVRGCFTLAIQDFSKEPLSTKENALDDEENPEFVFSRNGDCSISVTGGNGMEIATSVLLVVMGIPNPS
ncbi:uncharacterized protein LOC128344146 [Hemicordylus capensis]|uniref:uncharacterized protein LOC128344146 n=1 Tax=Hemicordylus capensis TaxID=884348 RepID=UPI002303C505|nr:uncharacterized protein LOC128344146 [Hemicordylus capensis]